MLLFLCLLACVLATGHAAAKWQNAYDKPLDFSCPNKQSIFSIGSVHDNRREDRVWALSCQDTFNTKPDCYWTDYINDFDKPFSFICPSYAVIGGMRSYHDNKREDRRWQFQCCRVTNVCNQNCKWTPYVNFFDEEISWEAPDKNYLAGVESYHENKYEDRRWKYYICSRTKC